jgi:hypothetical protein
LHAKPEEHIGNSHKLSQTERPLDFASPFAKGEDEGEGLFFCRFSSANQIARNTLSSSWRNAFAALSRQVIVVLGRCPRLTVNAAPLVLKGASAMVLLLRINVFQYGFDLAWAHRKRAIPALPEKTAIASVKRFDPFRGYLLYLFDEPSLGNSSRQHRDNVNMISDTANTHHFGTEITADRGKISMHPWPYV